MNNILVHKHKNICDDNNYISIKWSYPLSRLVTFLSDRGRLIPVTRKQTTFEALIGRSACPALKIESGEE